LPLAISLLGGQWLIDIAAIRHIYSNQFEALIINNKAKSWLFKYLITANVPQHN
jgi:hypothetical protein